MAEQQIGRGLPDIGPLYIKTTTPRTDGAANLPGALDIFGSLSITSQFKVSLHLSSASTGDFVTNYLSSVGLTNDAVRNEYYNFYCAETTLPGSTFDTFDEAGSRQGVVETFPLKRVYTPFTMTFYVDNDYRLIRLFEEWMNYINPIYNSGGSFVGGSSGQGDAKNSNNYFRLKYPNTYKKIISVVKFEKNFFKYTNPELKDPNIIDSGQLGNVPTITYRMIDAYPTNITGMPVSYEGSTILKTTVDFSYSRYVIEKNDGTGPGDLKN